jgi:selenide,water dikinase
MSHDLMTKNSSKVESIKLTQYSHGAGCGCKISPSVLENILKGNTTTINDKKILVGNSSKDDAAVYDLDNGTALISTTDFFTPIVDDAFQFGRIAAANAISDVYAMGGTPILAISILGWPVNILSSDLAQKVIEGGRSICDEACISLAGGHSIDSPEPIFGLAVNGIISKENIKRNNLAKEGDLLFLTKPLGVGILTTAEKKKILKQEHHGVAATQMMLLNKIGESFGRIKEVNAMTDVTGYGLLGHLIEMAEGSGLSASLNFEKVPLIIDDLGYYADHDCVPGGTNRNWDSYKSKVSNVNHYQKIILADPQTSGGLLIAVEENGIEKIKRAFFEAGIEFTRPIGRLIKSGEKVINVN